MSNNPSPKISVFFPNYNHARYLRQSIESVLRQTFRDFELVIIDDGSTDDSWNIIQEYAAKDPRIVAEKFPENRGVEPAIKRGVQLCKGEYLFGRASDDYLISDNFFQQAMDAMTRYPEAAGAFGGSEVVHADSDERFAIMGCRQDAEKAGRPYTFLPHKQAQKDFLYNGLFVPGASSIWRRALTNKAGGYDPSLGPQSDYFLNHVLPMLNGVIEIHSLVAAVRAYPDSYSALADDTVYFTRHARVEKKIRALVPEVAQDDMWKNWRGGVIRARIPDPVTPKPAAVAVTQRTFPQRVAGYARRKLQALIRRLPARAGTPMEKIQRQRQEASVIFEKVVCGNDTL